MPILPGVRVQTGFYELSIRFGTCGRQPLPNRVTSELLVIRWQSAICENWGGEFPINWMDYQPAP
jgi:hypothetical protein